MSIGGGVPGRSHLQSSADRRSFRRLHSREHLDMPVDYESLIQVGSMMGSGGMIVMDDTSCMVDVARFFMEFCMTESCGKCIPCRVGTAQMFTLLSRICDGTGTIDDLELLVDLCALSEDQLVWSGTDSAQPGTQHAALLQERIHRAHRGQTLSGRRLQHSGSRGGVSMSAAVDVNTHHRWPGSQRPRWRDHSRGRTREQDRHPHPLPTRRTERCGRMPALPGRDQRQHQAAARLRSPGQRGMEVSTATERLKKHRRTILEMLFAERNHICSVCVANGHCESADSRSIAGA